MTTACRINWMVDTHGGTSRLRMSVRWNGQRCSVMLGYNIDPDKWSQDMYRVKPNTTHGRDKTPAHDINKRIELFEEYARDIVDRNPAATSQQFRDLFDERLGKKQKKVVNIQTILQDFIAQQSVLKSWSKPVRTKYLTVGAHLKEYDPDIKPEDITNKTLSGFLEYMVDKGYRNSYISHIVKVLKGFIKWMANEGIYTGNAHKTFMPRLRGDAGNSQAVVYLTWDELMHLYSLEGLPPHLAQVRDVFCFCSLTSLRYSDAAKLKRSDIQSGAIYVVTQKTTDSLKIELNKRAQAILDKYADTAFPGDKALPVISNQKTNEYLKELGRRAGFDSPIRTVFYNGAHRHEQVHPKWEVLSTHAARRTFVVNALYLGIPAEVIIRWTGHKDYKAMKPYIAIVDTLKEREMSKFDAI